MDMFARRRSRGFGLLALVLLSSNFSAAFRPSPLSRVHRSLSSSSLLSSSSGTALAASSDRVVVISPPGGLGEIASVEAARLGGSVRWFVIGGGGSSSGGQGVALTGETLADVERAGGSIELAGADAADLLAESEGDDGDVGGGAAAAVASWCRGAKCIVCSYDGADEERRRVDRNRPDMADDKGEDTAAMIRSAVRVAAREAAESSNGSGFAGSGGVARVAILAAGEEKTEDEESADDDNAVAEAAGAVGGFLTGLLGGNKVVVPESLREALGGKKNGRTEQVAVLRHGGLFGAPESSPESSPFMGGPRREPIVRDMFTMRSVRIDPAVSKSGNVWNAGSSADTISTVPGANDVAEVEGASKTNRLALGTLAARLSTGAVDAATARGGRANIEVGVSSFVGTDSPTAEEWNAELNRALDASASSSSAGGAGSRVLFEAKFASVPSVDRLARWVAEKWAPAVLRSYDLAGTRVGARPVSAAVVGAASSGDEGDTAAVEIVWQTLVDFKSVASGRMIVKLSERGMTATRGPGDAGAGFGKISARPLPGEDELIRRLADAASQAVEKGLAVKVKSKKAARAKAKAVATTPPPVAAAAPAAVVPVNDASGPRTSGARRSAERTRGKKRVRKDTGSGSGSDGS